MHWQRGAAACQDRRKRDREGGRHGQGAAVRIVRFFHRRTRTSSTTGTTWNTSRNGCACPGSSTQSAGSATRTRTSPSPPTISTRSVFCTARRIAPIGGANASVWTKRVTAIAHRILRYEGDQMVPGDATAPAGAGGLLVASMNVDPAAEPEFNEWYNAEHLPQLAAVPGVLCARRYQSSAADRERQVPGAVPHDRAGCVAFGRLDQGGGHRMDPPHAPAFPRHAGAALQAIPAGSNSACPARARDVRPRRSCARRTRSR